MFERIGSEYPAEFPVYLLRLLPAVAGALLLPAAYCLLRQLGVARPAAALAGLLLMLGKGGGVAVRFASWLLLRGKEGRGRLGR